MVDEHDVEGCIQLMYQSVLKLNQGQSFNYF